MLAPTGARGGDRQPISTSLVPQVVTFGVLTFGATAFAGGAKGLVMPPPDGQLVLVYLLFAMTFFVVGMCLWFVGGVFTDRRFASAEPEKRVKLAREALAPILEILGLLHKAPAKPATGS
jgi:hypothetical protein